MINTLKLGRARGVSIALAAVGCIAIATSCNENLPSGPATFAGTQLQIVVPHDTIVVGDSSTVQAKATDAGGHIIQLLKFGWTTGDSTMLALAAATSDSDVVAGRKQTLVARKPGRVALTLTLPDTRFVVPTASRNETVVVGGVKVLSSHDSTLTAVNDTGVAIATSLVKSNGAFINRASQGIKWTHLGTHTVTVGQGDTIRYVGKSNGPDTLIASHDFCLFGAKCADTVVARVSQQLSLTLSAHAFSAWSLGDSLGPSITLADRRGNGLSGTAIRFVPVAVADSAIVRVVGPFGVGNPASGVMPAPQLVSIRNGTAKVMVFGVAPDGFSVVAVDSITEVVRQVARHVAVEQLRPIVSSIDSIPFKPVVRDARGATIDDATIIVTPSGVRINDVWAVPTVAVVTPLQATLSPEVIGSSLPAANPGAPQVPVIVDQSILTMIKTDTVTAGATALPIQVQALDSLGNAAIGKWVRFGTSFGFAPDSVRIDVSGIASTVWIPSDSAMSYTLTGIRGTTAPLVTVADTAGRVVLRRTVVVKADIPSSLKTTLSMSSVNLATGATAVVTVTVKDRFGNTAKTATPADLALTAAAGTFGAINCTLGICTSTYTAPGAAGPDTINVKIGGLDVLFSPMAVTIH